MRLNRKLLGSRGDTIVEVLIVVTILGFILMISYSVATRTQRTNRQTEEHSQALKIAESQLENLRAYPSAISDAKFCFDTAGQVVALPAGVQAADYASENFTLYPAGCQRPPIGGTCASYCYYVSISKGSGDLYTVAVRWNGPTGKKDQVSLQYRMPAL